jgi:hypothetical protein
LASYSADETIDAYFDELTLTDQEKIKENFDVYLFK